MGYGMATFVTSVLRRFFEFPDLNNIIYPNLYLQGLSISLVCSLIGSWQGTRRALRLSPAEAMRAQPPVAGGRIWLEHFSGLWQRLSFGWRLVLRNVVRHKARTVVGIFAACMGAAILTSGFMLRFGIEYIIEFQFEKVIAQRCRLEFQRPNVGGIALQECRELPGVEYAEPTLDVSCDFFNGPYHHKGAVTGLQSNARLLVPHDQAGRTVNIQPVGLTMTRKMARLVARAAWRFGGNAPTKGLRQARSVPVANISDSYVGLSVYAISIISVG